MTPLAQRTVTQALRKGVVPALELFEGAQLFEVTGALDLVFSETGNLFDLAPEWALERTFLPARKTWIEWDALGRRMGCMFEAVGEKGALHNSDLEDWLVTTLHTEPGDPLPWMSKTRSFPDFTSNSPSSASDIIVRHAIEFLPIINAGPALVDLYGERPHKGLARKAVAAGVGGPWRDEGWHRVTLNFSTQRSISDDETGKVCAKKRLHFCRAHLRVRNGSPGIVRAHWRGDAALGMVPKTYQVTA